ncbi:ABC transporter ATP-binding protein [Candidatus Poribacteria bacterium]|nr:ABC transporter ATP-binding protein [Candidatus Poribacteria bacterium]
MKANTLLELQNLTKNFGSLVAVDNVNFELQVGEIHAILGENGAGKSTLMNLIYGLYQPSSGYINIYGKKTILKSPSDAIAHGIGMVHQHFMLIENLTVAENIALSVAKFDPTNQNNTSDSNIDSLPNSFKSSINISKFLYDKAEAIELTESLSKRFNLPVEPNSLIRDLSVGLKQRVEILKALAVNTRILILDEPTAVLSPQEVEDFFSVLRTLQADKRSIIFISHKMKEVLTISDRITVLRRGKNVYNGKTGELSARGLAKEMLGEELSEVVRGEHKTLCDQVLNISNLNVLGNRNENAVMNLSLETHRGEIVGIAGVDGNGQLELAEAILGLRPISSGTIEISGKQPTKTKDIRQCGVGYIPEDRRTKGVIQSFSIAENLMLNFTHLNNVTQKGIINQESKYDLSENLIASYDIRPTIPDVPASTLSGGNQQKIVLAREISQQPELLIAVNPTRGLDINATFFVHEKLLAQRDKDKSVLLISTELDEILRISDRIYVMYRGSIIEATEHRENIEALGLIMTGESDRDG